MMPGDFEDFEGDGPDDRRALNRLAASGGVLPGERPGVLGRLLGLGDTTTYMWATWLADALRADPVLAPRVVEVDGVSASGAVIIGPGWRTFGRPPPQFSFYPTGVLDHHTACMLRTGHDPSSCVRAIIAGRSDAPGPISQILITATPCGVRWNGSNCDPRVYVLAAGRANHAGAGTWPWGAPEGNGSAIGNECCGPPDGRWPDLLIDIRARVSAAQLKHQGWGIDRLTLHNEYAPTRKIDPSGAWRDEPDLAQLRPWNHDRWRAAVKARLTEPLPEVGADMDALIRYRENVYAVYDAAGCFRWVRDRATLDMIHGLRQLSGKPALTVQDLTGNGPTVMQAIGYLVGPKPPSVDAWGVK